MPKLFGAAASVLIAAVLGAALSEHPDWTWPVAGAAAIAAIIAVLLSYGPLRRRIRWARTRDDRAAEFRAGIAKLIAEGNEIMRDLPQTMDAAILNPIEAAAEKWGTRARDFLDAYELGLSAQFLDESDGRAHFGSQFEQRDRIRNWPERRLSKLAEIVRSAP